MQTTIEQMVRFIEHLFSKHIKWLCRENFMLAYLRAYYSIRHLNNPYLASFQLLQIESKDTSFKATTQMLIHHKHIDQLIHTFQKQKKEEVDNINIDKLLQHNRLQIEFKSTIETVSEEIYDFWDSLVNTREPKNMFQAGIDIDDSLSKLKLLFSQIMAHEGPPELKVYVKMARFYEQVLFKPYEARQLINQVKDAQIGIKTIHANDNFQGQKCLVLVRVCLNEPMPIIFMNKKALQMAQYSSEEVFQLTINDLMPTFIEELHQDFVNRFMETGEMKMLGKSSEQFIRQHSGTIVPITTYLTVSSTVQSHMVLLFEENQNYTFFPQQSSKSAFIIVRENFILGETSNNFYDVTSLPENSIRHLQAARNVLLDIDDILICKNYNCEISQLRNLHQTSQCEVFFRSVFEEACQQMIQDESQRKFNQFVDTYQKRQNNSSIKGLSNENGLIEDETFLLKIMDRSFLDGRAGIKIIGICKMDEVQGARTRNAFVRDVRNKDMSVQQLLNDEDSTTDDGPNDYSSIAASSQGSDSSAGAQLISNAFSQQISDGTPRSLKNIIYMIILVTAAMIVTSSIVLQMSLSNLTGANSISLTVQNSYNSYGEMSQSKIYLRCFLNIIMGYENNTSQYVADRSSAYLNIVKIQGNKLISKSEAMLSMIQQLDSLQNQPALLVWLLGENGDAYQQNLTLIQGLQQVGIDLQSIVAQSSSISSAIKSLQMPFFNLTSALAIINSNGAITQDDYQSTNSSSLIERQLFFILNNSNDALYAAMNQFSDVYEAKYIQLFSDSLTWLNDTSFIAIAIISVIAIAMLPLFNKIQKRIIHLMNLFFAIEPESKKLLLGKIRIFQMSSGSATRKGMTQQQEMPQAIESALDSAREAQDVPMESPVPLLRTPKQPELKRKDKNEGKKVKQTLVNESNSNDSFSSSNTSNDAANVTQDHIKKKKAHKGEQAQIETIEVARKDDIQQFHFLLYIKRRRITQSIIIICAALIFISYFVVMYLRSSSLDQDFRDGIRDIARLFARGACLRDIMNQYVHNFFATNITTDSMQNIRDRVNHCIQVENDFMSSYTTGPVKYFSQDVMNLTNYLEAGLLCPMVTSSLSTPSNCLQMSEPISKIGLQSYLNGYMHNLNQAVFDLKDQLSQGSLTVSFLQNQFNNQLYEYTDALILVIQPTIITLEAIASQSVGNYFLGQSNVITWIFICYAVLTFVFLLLFFFGWFIRLRREMMQSNRLLYLLDYEMMTEPERDSVLKFIKNS